jgi:hypothetical protein
MGALISDREMSNDELLWSQLTAYCESMTPADTKQQRPRTCNASRHDRSVVTVAASRWDDYLPYFIASLGLPIDGKEAIATKLVEMRRTTEPGECTHTAFFDTGLQHHIECHVFLLAVRADEQKYRLAYLKTTTDCQ